VGFGRRSAFALKKHCRTRLPSPLGALRAPGGLPESPGDADHQTLGEVLDEAARRVTQSYIISRQDYRKGAAFAPVLGCRFES
jgi:hypothetical protein